MPQTKTNLQNFVKRSTKEGSCITSSDSSTSTRPSNTENTSPDLKTCLQTVDTTPQKCLCLITAINFNQLGYFLIANILTGLVNLSSETITASPFKAFVILNTYLLVLNCIIVGLYRYKIILKV